MKGRMIRRIASLGLCLAMVFTSLPAMAVTAYAEETCESHTTESYNENGICKACQTQAVASLCITSDEDEETTSYYPTLQAAVDAANGNEDVETATVMLLKDQKEEVIINGGCFTLNLNRKCLSSDNATLSIYSDVKINITGDGTVKGKRAISCSRGEITIENGSFIGTLFSIEGNSCYNLNLTIEDGCFIGGRNGLSFSCYGNDDNTITIKGGTFQGDFDPDKGTDPDAIYNYYGMSMYNIKNIYLSGNVTITGGDGAIELNNGCIVLNDTLVGGPYSICVVSSQDAPVVFAKGDNEDLCSKFTVAEEEKADAKIITWNEEENTLSYGKCKHAEVNKETSICGDCELPMQAIVNDSVYYSSADDLLYNATEGGVITLLKDIPSNKYMDWFCNYTIDLNGFSLGRESFTWYGGRGGYTATVKNSASNRVTIPHIYNNGTSGATTVIQANVDIGNLEILKADVTINVSEADFKECKVSISCDGCTAGQFVLGDYSLYDIDGNALENTAALANGATYYLFPAISMTAGEQVWNAAVTDETYDLLLELPMQVTVSMSEILEVSKVEYMFADENMETGTWTEISEENGSYSFEISELRKGVIYVRVTDTSSKELYINSENLIVYQNCTIADNKVREYKSGEDLEVEAAFGDTELKEIKINYDEQEQTLIKDIDYTVSEERITFLAEWLDTLNAGEYSISVILALQGEESQEVTKEMVLEICPKQISVTGATADSRTYDGTNQILIKDIALSENIVDDGVSIAVENLMGTLDGADAGDYTTVLLPELKLTDTSNYILNQPQDAVELNEGEGVTIHKATPELGNVTADAIMDTQNISEIMLHRTNTDVAGTLTIDAGQSVVVGTNELSYTFTPTDTKNYDVVTGKVTVEVKESSSGVDSGDTELTPEPEPTPDAEKGTWVQDGGNWYYVDENGTKETGWVNDDGTWYYMDESGVMQTDWEYVDNTWYYMDESGAMLTGWVLDGNTWYYMDGSGAMQTGWVLDGNTWYYMNGSGAMQTGWVLDRGTWYYLNASGAMATGWVLDGSTWYYMNGSGAMQTGWEYVNHTWYYMDKSGAMQTGWVYYKNDWYYMNPSGAMATGWVLDKGTWYYLDDDGEMVTGRQKIAGKTYYFNKSGAWIE